MKKSHTGLPTYMTLLLSFITIQLFRSFRFATAGSLQNFSFLRIL